MEAAKRYDLNAGTLQPLTEGYQNVMYSFETPKGSRILRITPESKRSYEERVAEINWLHYLDQLGLSVSNSIPSIENRLIETVYMDGEKYYLTAFIKAEGCPVNVGDRSEWNISFFQKWGRVMGKMHHVTKSFQPNGPKRMSWHETNRDMYHFKKLPVGIADKYEKLLKRVDTFQRDQDTFGLIHFDFHQGNFLTKDNTITLFDFDDCAYYWFAHDIAVSYYHAYWQGTSWYPEWKTFGKDFMISFLDGYQHENSLPKEILQQIPTFLKMREIFLYQLFLEKWNMNELEEWQSETLQNLKYQIEDEIPHPFIEI